MIRWLREKVFRRRPVDPALRARARDDADRANWKLWKTRTPPTPRR